MHMELPLKGGKEITENLHLTEKIYLTKVPPVLQIGDFALKRVMCGKFRSEACTSIMANYQLLRPWQYFLL